MASKELGWDTVGYESDINEVNFAKSMGVDLKLAFLSSEDMSIVSGARVASAINVLEHIESPTEFVRAIQKT